MNICSVIAQVELDEGEEAKFLFTGDAGDIIGVSFLQCTGEKPQFIYVELEVKNGASVFSEATRPGCIMVRAENSSVSRFVLEYTLRLGMTLRNELKCISYFESYTRTSCCAC